MAGLQLGAKIIKRDSETVYVIAEIGQNHQGSIEMAKQMILEAKNAGCDCVKFQKSCLPSKFTKAALNRIYASENSWGSTYGEHKEYLEFSEAQYRELQMFCKDAQIDFTASAMDEVSLEFLDSLDVPFIKIGSGDVNNFPLFQKAARLQRTLVISTGMCQMETVNEIARIMRQANKTNYALLHCVSAYPTAPRDCNLQLIYTLKQKFPQTIIGYSGHELGIDITKAAVLCGARIIERHFTLDKNQKGSDHKCSLEPQELRQLIEDIKGLPLNKEQRVERGDILGLLGPDKVEALPLIEREKQLLRCEMSCKQKLGKSIVAAQQLAAGHILQTKDLCIKVSEPNGIPAEQYYAVLGAKLKTDVMQDMPLNSECLLRNGG